LGYTPFILGFVLLLNPLLTPLFAAALAYSGGGLLPIVVRPDSSLAAHVLFALFYAFVWDLTQYGLHRMQHAVPVLWETHKFHHDEVALSAVAQARHHPTSSLLAACFHLPVLVLFGTQAPHLVVAFLMFTLWGFVNHANVRIGFGALTPVIAGPQWHRIHHSIRDEHRDRNFAVLFPAIDMMFGTYYRPRPDEYPPTGLAGERLPSLRAATVEPFLGWYRMLRPARERP
jgi:sterol desaturase/sphingolipid hydroxylase (fatty acid hydroxylase superfamily)